jgi:phage gp16-like protein
MPQPDPRKRDLALIHVGKKALGLSDEDYRAMLWAVARAKSSGDLDAFGRRKVLGHLKSRGFKPQRKGRTQPAEGRELLVRKIRALLINDPAGAKEDAYADAIAQRMFKVDRFEWCNPEQLRKIIQALEVDARRRG